MVGSSTFSEDRSRFLAEALKDIHAKAVSNRRSHGQLLIAIDDICRIAELALAPVKEDEA